MSRLGRCTLTILAVLVLPIIGCTKQAADSLPADDPIQAAQATQDTEPRISDESDQLETAGLDSGGAQGLEAPEPVVIRGRVPVGAELQAILERLDRLERGLPLLAYPEPDEDLMRRIEVAQKQLKTAKKGVQVDRTARGLGDMMDLMSLALTQLSGQAEPCPEPGERSEFLESAQQQLDDARRWVEESPDNPNADVLLAILDSAQEELDSAKTGACTGQYAS